MKSKKNILSAAAIAACLFSGAVFAYVERDETILINPAPAAGKDMVFSSDEKLGFTKKNTDYYSWLKEGKPAFDSEIPSRIVPFQIFSDGRHGEASYLKARSENENNAVITKGERPFHSGALEWMDDRAMAEYKKHDLTPVFYTEKNIYDKNGDKLGRQIEVISQGKNKDFFVERYTNFGIVSTGSEDPTIVEYEDY